ncbi:hypothetical protein FOL47_008427 [Perkinsus chesapeaki]|uniref:CSC1/OSCA1-like 7TM region domain-containing protein n=1 Tax=Perkinsus chesapeaki TaxID=330153 RepID=A0A7J6MTQ7_PERCH|nr:hypothetical protein FOL47_008427 [Perkinsus chesapeaki]
MSESVPRPGGTNANDQSATTVNISTSSGGAQQPQTIVIVSGMPGVSTSQVAPLNVSPQSLAVAPGNETKEVLKADKEAAKRHLMITSCTTRDRETDTYKWRSIWKTSRAELGEFGVGIQLYFDFLLYLGIVLLVMACMAAPLLHKAAQGDLAGVGANIMVKSSIGNIGECGRFGEICTDVTYIPYRKLNPGSDVMLRERTPLYGGLDSGAIVVLLLFAFVFYSVHIKRTVRQQDEDNVTPSDFAIHVMDLPKRVGSTPQEHALYAEKLKEHFEKLVKDMPDDGVERDPDQPVVCEVALARDYDGAIRNFLGQGKLYIEKRELEAQAAELYSTGKAKKARKLEQKIAAIDAKLEKMSNNVKSQKDKMDVERDVCQAHVIFNEEAYKKFILHRYRFSGSWLWRLCQARVLRFEGQALNVKQAYEPSNIYFAGIPRDAAPVGNKDIWIIGNYSRPEGDGCFEICDVQMYSDENCQDNLFGTIGVEKVFDSTGDIKVMNPMSHEAVDGVGFNSLTNAVNNLSICSSTTWSPRTCVEPDELDTLRRRRLSPVRELSGSFLEMKPLTGSFRQPRAPVKNPIELLDTVSVVSVVSRPPRPQRRRWGKVKSRRRRTQETYEEYATAPDPLEGKHMTLRMSGHIPDQGAIRNAIKRGFGPSVHIETKHHAGTPLNDDDFTLEETPQEPAAETVCSEKQLANEITLLDAGTATDFASAEFVDVELTVCGSIEAITCAERKLTIADETIMASTVLYGGIATFNVSYEVLDGCPVSHDDTAGTPYGPDPYPDSKHVNFSIRGSLDQSATRDALYQTFGSHVHLEAHYVVGNEPASLWMSETESLSGETGDDLANFSCDVKLLATALTSLKSAPAGDFTFDQADILLTACGPEVVISCIEQQVEAAKSELELQSSVSYAGIENISIDSTPTDGCPGEGLNGPQHPHVEDPNFPSKHVNFSIRGSLDQSAIRDALYQTLGSHVHLEAHYVVGNEPASLWMSETESLSGETGDDLANFSCDVKLLATALTSLKSAPAGDFTFDQADILLTACGPEVVISCIEQQVEAAKSELELQSSVSYAGIESISLESTSLDGCPGDIGHFYNGTEPPYDPYFHSKHLNFSITGPLDQFAIYDALHKTFGPQVRLEAKYMAGYEPSSLPMTQLEEGAGGVGEDPPPFVCDAELLASTLTLLKSAPLSDFTFDPANVVFTVCGPNDIVDCIEQQVKTASSTLLSQTDISYAGIESLALESAAIDGCPGDFHNGPDYPNMDMFRKHVEFELRGYMDQASVKHAFEQGLGPSVWLDAFPIEGHMLDLPPEEFNSTMPMDEGGYSALISNSTTCAPNSLVKSLEVVNRGTEEDFKSGNEMLHMRVTACATEEEVGCLLEKLQLASDLVANSGDSLYAGISMMHVNDTVYEGCPNNPHGEEPYDPYEWPEGVQSQKFVVKGNINMKDEAIGNAFDTAMGHFAGFQEDYSSRAYGNRRLSKIGRRLQSASGAFECNETALEKELMGLQLIAATDAAIQWPYVELQIVACSMESECVTKQLQNAATMLAKSSSAGNTYAGLSAIDVDGVITNGCPHIYDPYPGGEYPYYENMSSIRLTVVGSWDEETVKNLVENAFGYDIFMDAILLPADDKSNDPIPYAASEEAVGDTQNPECEEDTLVKMMESLPVGAPGTGGRKKAEITACGEKMKIICIGRMLEKAREYSSSLSSEFPGGIELMAALGPVEDGCPLDFDDQGPYVPPALVGQKLTSLSWVLRGYHDIDGLGDMFHMVTGENVISRADPFYPPADGSSIAEAAASSSSSQPIDTSVCAIDAMVRATEVLSPKTEAEAKNQNQAYSEHIVTACSLPEQTRCIYAQIQRVFNMTKQLSNGALIGGLSGGFILAPGIQDGCPLIDMPANDNATDSGSQEREGAQVLVLTGYYLEEEMSAIFQTALGGLRMQVEGGSVDDTDMNVPVAGEIDSGNTISEGELPRRTQLTSCEFSTLAKALRTLPIVKEEVIASQRKYRETRVVICGSVEQLACLKKKVAAAQSLMNGLDGALYGGLVELTFDGDGLPVCPMDGPIEYQPTATLSSKSIEFTIDGYLQVQGIAKNLREAFGSSVQDVFLVDDGGDDGTSTMEPGEVPQPTVTTAMTDITGEFAKTTAPTVGTEDMGEFTKTTAPTVGTEDMGEFTKTTATTVGTEDMGEFTKTTAPTVGTEDMGEFTKTTAPTVGTEDMGEFTKTTAPTVGTEVTGEITKTTAPTVGTEDMGEFTKTTAPTVGTEDMGEFTKTTAPTEGTEDLGEFTETTYPTGGTQGTGEVFTTTGPSATFETTIPSSTTPPVRILSDQRWLQDTATTYECSENALASAISDLKRQAESTMTLKRVELKLRACAKPARVECIKKQIEAASKLLSSSGSELYGGIKSIRTDGVVREGCDTSDRIDTGGVGEVSIAATNCLSTQTACSNDPDRRCYDSSKRCDRTWFCPGGDDEMSCTYQCLASEVRCPATGLCIPKDLHKGGCQECADEAYAEEETCLFLKQERESLLDLKSCNAALVSEIIFARYGAGCTFDVDPCCVMDKVALDETATDALKCDGYTYRPSLIAAGTTLLVWGRAYCENFQRMQSATSCTVDDIDVLRYSSMSCETFLLSGSLACECFADLGGILQEDRDILESCDTFRADMKLPGITDAEVRSAIRRNLGTTEHRMAWDSVKAKCDAQGGLQKLAATQSLISDEEKNPVKKLKSKLTLGGDLSSIKDDPAAYSAFKESFKATLLDIIGSDKLTKDSMIVNGIVMAESNTVTTTTAAPQGVTTTTQAPPRRLQTSTSSGVSFELTVDSGSSSGTLADRTAGAATAATSVAGALTSLNSDPSSQSSLLTSLQASVPNMPPITFLGLAEPQVRDAIEQLCLSPKFKCPVTGTCIEERFVCNQIPECEVIEPGETVAADERGCTFTTPAPGAQCKDTQFQCGSGECIEDVFYCDEFNDCADASDETHPECVAQLEARREMEAATASQASAVPVTLVKDWFGVMFATPVTVKCIKFMQPIDKMVADIKMFACDESEVFRDGVGVVLRKPETSCKSMKVITLVDTETNLLQHSVTVDTTTTTTTTTPTTASGQSLAYSAASAARACSSGNCDVVMMNTNYECYDATGEIVDSDDIGSGVCKVPRPGDASTNKVEDDDRCDISLPISLARVKKIRAANVDDSDLLEDDTYKCFCYQQLQFNIANGNTRYFFPPYSGEAQKLCEPYLLQKLFEFFMAIVAVLSVSILNWLLKAIIYFLVDMEKHTSVTTKEMSLMKKLFLAQWINTGLIILFVNAQLHGMTTDIPVVGTTLRIGDGEYDDFTSTWYKAVGIGLSITIAVQIASAALPPIVAGFLKLVMMPFTGKKKKTQDAMNQVYKLPDFNLALRLAQTMNVLFCTIMYSSSMPLLLIIGAVYCFVAYWADKICLLRFSARPPAFTQETVMGAIKLFPLAALMHCLLAFWMLSNQTVFPSDFFSDMTEARYVERYMSGANAKRYEQIMFKGVPTGDFESFKWYVGARIEDGFRKATIGEFIVMMLIVAYFGIYLFYNIFGTHIMACLRACWQCCHTKKGKQMSTITSETYTDSVNEMIQSGMIHSYELKNNHRYDLAYTAISEIEQKSRNSKVGLQSPHPQQVVVVVQQQKE